MRRKETISKMLVMVMLIVMTSCTTVNETSKSDVVNGDETAETKKGNKDDAPEIVTVDFWTAPQQVQYNLWENRAQVFNQTRTMADGKIIQVKVQQMPETPSSEAGIQNAIATETAPAVSENINRGFAAILADSEAVYDLSQETWFQEILEARQMGAVMDKWSINGKQYVLPLYVNPIVWQWNAKGLKAMGFEKAPETMDEFQTVLKAYGEQADKLAGIGITHTLYRPSLTRPDQFWERWFDFIMVYNGLSQGKSIVEGNRLTMDKKFAKQAVELIGAFGNTIQQGELSSVWLEEVPSVLVTICAPWDISLYHENNKIYGEDFVYGSPIVWNKGDKPYNYADSKGLVFYKTENISEEEHWGAVEFVKWVYNKENSAKSDLEWLKETTMLPVRGDMNENEIFAEIMKEYPELSALAPYATYAVPGLATPKDPDIWTAFTEVCMSPYATEAFQREIGHAPDADSYIEAAIEAMKQAGGLE